MNYEIDQAFIKTVNEGLVPKIEESAYVASLVPTPEDVDVKFAVELGVSIMLDKPIFAIVAPGEKVPDKLLKVADKVIEADVRTEEGQQIIARELAAFHERLERLERQ